MSISKYDILLRMEGESMSISNKLMEFLDKSHSNFHAVNEMAKMMYEQGFKKLKMNEKWELDDKSKYYVLVNNSSVFAFDMNGYKKDFAYKIVASHTDAPTFKVKPNAVKIENNTIIVNSESYGGLIDYTWLDRPLKLSGRVIVKEGNRLVTKLYSSNGAVGIIPSLAIHMNRSINSETKFNRHTQMRPLLGQAPEFDFKEYLAKELSVEEGSVVDYDLVFKPVEKATYVGVNQEFIASNHLDNLQSAYLTFEGFMNAENNNNAVNVYASFDNEEVGSMTKQGAQATILKDILNRIGYAMGQSPEEHLVSVAKSFIISADNAHANHPNYANMNDENHVVNLNGGVVVKYSANQKYTTDSLSSALITSISEISGAAIQTYVNRADAPGGSTLGAISGTQVSVMSVDIGLPQLAMHSSMELSGTKDNEDMVTLIKSYYDSKVVVDEDNITVEGLK